MTWNFYSRLIISNISLSFVNKKMSTDVEEIEGVEEVAEDSQQQESKVIVISSVALGSLAFHAVILLIIALIPGQVTEEPEPVRTVIQEVAEEKEEPPPPEIPTEIEVPETEVEVEVEEVTEEVVEEEVVEVTEEAEVPNEEPVELEMSDVQGAGLDGPDGPPMVMGVGSSGFSGGGGGLPGGYGNRTGKGRKNAGRRYGAGSAVENAIDRALKWLHYHQEPDGSWNAAQAFAPGEKVPSYGRPDAATGLALLAFLGNGVSEKMGPGPYRKSVTKGIRNLLDQLEKKPGLGNTWDGQNYNRAIVLMALSEALIFGSSDETRQKAETLAEILLARCMNEPMPSGLDHEKGSNYGISTKEAKTGKMAIYDMSMGGWFELALKSAKSANLKAVKTQLAHDFFDQYKDWIKDEMTNDSTGKARYRTGGDYARKNMIPVGMLQRHFLGFPRNDAFLVNASDLVVNDLLDYYFPSSGPNDSYGIYYGALACFMQQGKAWREWNNRMKESLIKSQEPGDPRDLGGSWDPALSAHGHVEPKGGRVMNTALYCLSLEVYFRFEAE